MDFFPEDYLIIVDESHITIPQVRGMYAGDQSRKSCLVDYGFRLPSAKDNRPLSFDEFENKSKIKIINDDALTYLDYPKYDFVYIDIYRDEADGLPLVGKLLNNPKLPLDTSFWFISSLIVYLRRFVIVSLEMASNPSFNEKEYGEFGRDLKDPTNVDYLIYKIYKDYIKPNNINAKENIDSLLSFESMLGLLKDLFK